MTSKKLPPIAVVRALDRVRDALTKLNRRLVPGHIALLEMQFAGFLSQAVSTAADLGIADQLADGPRTSAQLADALEVDEDGLRRLLRLLVSYGVFAQRRDGRYALTRIGTTLRGDAAVTMREVSRFFGSPYHRNHWTHLGDAVRTGEAVGTALEGASFFEYAARDREVGDLFDRAMTSVGTLSIDPLLAAYDFGRFATIVDVGGGHGSLLLEILRRHPTTNGVLFDLPGVVEDLSTELASAGLEWRCTVEAGSFFEAVPSGADAYLLKNVLHDWSDEHAEHILRTIRAAMSPTATLLVIELVLPEHHRPHPGKFVDLEMLVNTDGGHERTEAQYRALLERGGFTLTRTVPTVAPVSVLEAVAR
ncbi:methyltransferase [Nocardia caishijiensis]|uniref:Hydroxyneurosporene-O-methyltransferase n=1 Tax=Nocardia caishijiensis TaxID=184756 RepID=A0ABQ6YK08_9NOCA|nr:methyltransferase [Nocardia caishijiensis]KAF0845861.1 hydroxyneurosporene-O-methyltransferase [Nocardia caishijiensis]